MDDRPDTDAIGDNVMPAGKERSPKTRSGREAKGAEIAAHGAIGNLRTVALVSTTGTIDFLCHPYIDSPSVFCALLDTQKGGAFAIGPVDGGEPWTTRQVYIPDTNVLITRFMNDDSVFELTDFMPIMTDDGPRSAVVRRVASIRGAVSLAICCAPRFDYGRDGAPAVAIEGDTATFTPNRDVTPGPLRLRSSVALTAKDGAATARFDLGEGDNASFILECGNEKPTGDDDPKGFIDASFEETIAYWQSWSAHSSYRGRWREYVMRSALVLKLLCSAEHGSIAAAATFGLPEEPGGSRNWDYRFCWIRDAAFAVYALMRLGYVGEAQRFNQWVSKISARREGGDFQILYRIDGSSEAEERPLDHLAGYGGAVADAHRRRPNFLNNRKIKARLKNTSMQANESSRMRQSV